MSDYLRWVDRDDCEEMRALARDGRGHEEIAEETGYSPITARRHCNDECNHKGASPYDNGTVPKADITAALAALADELDRIPSTVEWRSASTPCADTHVIDRFGSWPEACVAAGLSKVAPGAGKAVRTAAYNRPELTDGFSEVRP